MCVAAIQFNPARCSANGSSKRGVTQQSNMTNAVAGDYAARDALDRMLVIAPDPGWVRTLPEGKLPDRSDFTRFGQDLAGRMKVWNGATAAAEQLADEFAQWLEKPDLSRVEPL